MSVEQVLYYSDNCFGTADSICFRRNVLRIFDLKTGINQTSMNQLEVYVALFCLEYGVSPFDIEIDLRIYQSGEIKHHVPEPEFIFHIMDTIIEFDKRVEIFKLEGLS